MKTVKLGNVCEFRRGLTYKKTDEAIESQNIVLRANNIALNGFKLNFDELKYISDTIEIPSIKYITKNTILICTASGSKSHLGKVALIDKDYGYAFGGFMGLLVPDHSLIDAKYLYLVLISKRFRELIDSLTDGTNINNLKFSLIQDFEFFLPSLEEQQQIVERLEAAFEKIDRAIELTEKNINSTAALLQAKFNEYFKSAKDNSSHSKLADITSLISRGVAPKYTDDNGTAILNQKCIRHHSIDMTLARKHDAVQKKVATVKYICANDVLINSTGQGTLGRTALVTAEVAGSLVDSHITIVRPIKELFEPNFFGYLMETFEDEFVAMATGTSGQTELPRSLLQELKVSYVTDKERQMEIAQELTALRDTVGQMTVVCVRRIHALQDLKQALLTQAFSESAVE